jgi:copper chaperone CopZ
MSTIYEVTGMTCGHCQTAVETEVGAVPGVTGVDVDLAAGRVEVHGDADDGAVRAAIEEAGYAAA